jgi:predicted alpha/beta hydrolase family esterase
LPSSTPVLILPGYGDSGPEHWQSHWERAGHLNADAGFGPWPEGRRLLAALTKRES